MLNRCALSLAVVLLGTGAAAAQEISPSEGRRVALGPVAGIAYYTVQPDGFRVVATLGGDADTPPVRVAITLRPGQSLVLSVPRAIGQPAHEMTFTRRGDDLVAVEPMLAMHD